MDAIILEKAAVWLYSFSAGFLLVTVLLWSAVVLSNHTPEQLRDYLIVTIVPVLISIGFGVLAIATYTLRNVRFGA